jgi:N-ethylmaleimide reductase
VVDAVHAKGSVIFLQLWHVGRQSHVSLTGGFAPLAPSAIPVQDLVYTKDGWIETSPSRALETSEAREIVQQFRRERSASRRLVPTASRSTAPTAI